MLANVECKTPEMYGHTLEQGTAALRTIENRFGVRSARESLTRLGCVKIAEVPLWGYAELVHFSKLDASNADDFCAALWAESVDFLQKLRPGGPWILTAILPDKSPGKKPTHTTTTRSPSEVREFLRAQNGTSNIYYSPNPTRSDLTEKAAKTDIAAIEYILADLDPEPNETSEDAQWRYLDKLMFQEFNPLPTMLMNSGNGMQALWRLSQPILLGDPMCGAERKRNTLSPKSAAQVSDVEARTEAIILRLGSKAGTQNVDRILRLPGTINLPNAKKRREGRVSSPARLHWFSTDVYALDAFPLPKADGKRKLTLVTANSSDYQPSVDFATLSELDVDALPVSRRIKNIIRTGDASEYNDDRSAALFAVLLAMGSSCGSSP